MDCESAVIGGNVAFGGGDDMAIYPKRENSKSRIKEAGKRLTEDLPYTEDVVEVFRIAHNWRMAHAYPMLQERRVLSRLAGPDADTAGRIKRMASIRRKLQRSPVGLDQMQDLGGIRAIVPNMRAVRALHDWYSAKPDSISRVDDYISCPKRGGYRSLHIVRRYDGSGSSWRGMKVEIQIRTHRQHFWATAVEAIGAMRGEDIKGGEGDQRWLRLLALMSGYLADKERQPVGEDIPSTRRERREELAELNHQLGAVAFLSAFRTASVSNSSTAKAFLIKLDVDSQTVSVEPRSSYVDGGESYFRQGDWDARSQSVLVAVDGVEALRRAYPNYFLDVGEFVSAMKVALDPSLVTVKKPRR